MEFGRERYLKQLLEREHNGLIKVITGMRRSGKSFLMNELFYRALIKKEFPRDRLFVLPLIWMRTLTFWKTICLTNRHAC